ncbi:uncharacterized protein PV07_08225 [Cladophialophora immunda]|uniref:Uncharacterized protein n=1 Tax=Cladophialophora immunda TaxID=569365 RepID=A0A0D1ZKS1_9EURO|nr:uncharacterized protein PV07_08225 [Cladophialophora immunda]KIW28571.1 hypothetical protein PV07_08225 [Cladophialophora immunda]
MASATTYGTRELYGGAITVELPVELIDSSDIRQIPDHQEVFLSPTTLTSIIFEINDYVRPGGAANPSPSPGPTTTTSTTTAPDGTTTTTTTTAVSQTIVNGRAAAATSQTPQGGEELDAEAAKYHFTDVISPPDTLASPLPNPQPVQMVDPSLAGYPAYMLAGNINSHEMAARRTTAPAPSSQQQSQPRPDPTSLVHQLALLVRLPPYNADVCVRVNVPVKEFVEAGQRMGSASSAGGGSSGTEAMIAQEVGHARDILARIVGTLAVRDWSLFNA